MSEVMDEKTETEEAFDADALFEQDAAEASEAAPVEAATEAVQEASSDGAAAASDAAEEEDPWAAALAEQEAAEATKPAPAPEPPPAAVREGAHDVFQPLSSAPEAVAARELDIVMNIPVKLNVELGRTKISIRQLLELAQGSVLELDGLAGDPMDILINGYLIAQGEVVVVEDRYGIRITDIITPTERVQKLNR